MITIDAQKEYSITKNFEREEINQKALLYLYQPMVGCDAITIYNTLVNEFDFKKILDNRLTHSRLFSLTRTETHKFNKARQLLEAINLLKTYDTGSGVLYELKKPLSFEEFNQVPHFVELVKGCLTEKEWMLTSLIFSKETTHNFKNISSNFSLVFNRQPTLQTAGTSKQTITLLKNIFENKYGFTPVVSEGCEKIINNDYVTNEVQLSEKELLEIMHNSVVVEDNERVIKENLLFNNFYSKRNGTNFASLLKIDLFNTNDTNEINQKIQEMSTMTPEDYVQSRLKQKLEDKYLLRLYNIQYLNHLESTDVNLIIEYSFWKNNGSFRINYIGSIAKTVSQNPSLENSLDVYRYLVKLTNANTAEMKKEPMDTAEMFKDSAPHRPYIDQEPLMEVPSGSTQIDYSKFEQLFGDDQ